MRTLTILTLLLGFSTAVCLPNDVGTHELPACSGKTIVKCQNHKVGPCGTGLAVTSWCSSRLQQEPRFRCGELATDLHVQSPALPARLPLLI